ncbi:hypothetical protein A5731_28165 [Mycolicibacterium conceptionense]|uniref:Uncharacterized protein n=1 Tax=Mycolicibacterium conceptionense TaxID=451644 RepID=A0A1A0P4H8_9MYCO|nr:MULTISPECIES: SIR2 family protein [Mycolicibacterium]MCW1825144.1 SIR2 family protein [Mycolicibacterium senegalense]OBB04552.1 hypothetical protein A5718_24425 [Mycolicibacterium conceptionense]OBE93835.1 hypothetical protein A5731_28165 [Mycolicibacterium conceptionense]OBF15161.1 hypothetical protein A5726_01000 [Mycolicibacterium conceptionense]OBF34625.1 hypothetical protein A5720_23580 [Mycolicibacterium conceptionense]
MTTHSLKQHSDYLRAALEQEKKPLGFLLGAGAPMSIRVAGQPLIPDLEALTRLVRDEVDNDLRASLETLIGHLDEGDQKNLEAVLNYVRALAALPGNEPIRGVDVTSLTKLDSEICRIVRKHVDADLPDGDNPYMALAIWIRAVRRFLPAQVFTTNYDLLVEQALERQRVAYFDGFMGSRQPVFDLQAIEEDSLPSRWTLLWKLHGSINWSQDVEGNVVRQPPDSANQDSALIYPSHLKYDQSRRLPYLAMMDRLRTFLRKPGAILISCGFSFRDQHINEVIDQSLRANPTASVHALLYGALDSYDEARRLTTNLHNLSLHAEDKGVIGGREGVWTNGGDADAGSPGETVTCALGDFAAFGEFVQGLTGPVPEREDSETPDA